jgi:hypothetical protein
MGAPVGNNNGATQTRLLTDALKRELTQRPDDVLAIANKLIERAKEGDSWAMALIHDRVDGKAPQPLVGGDEEDGAPIRLLING